MDSIFETLHKSAKIYKSGGGVGINFSSLRPENFSVKTTSGISSGPISFMKIFDAAIAQIKAGGVRRGACLAGLEIDHPEIVNFIKCKDKDGDLSNMNISVLVKDLFMQNLKEDPDRIHICHFGSSGNYIILKETGKWVELTPEYKGTFEEFYSVGELWDLLVKQAYKNGEPGILFIDTMRKDGNDSIICTNPCQPSWATLLTPKGRIIIEDVKAGDIIWSGKRWTKVTKKTYTGIEEVYKYYTPGGIFIGTQNHNVISNGKKVEAKDAKSIDIALPELEAAFPSEENLVYKAELIRRDFVYSITVDDPEHTYWTGGLLVSNCGEVPGEPFEACVLGSIDISNFTIHGLDSDIYQQTVKTAVEFLNNCIDYGHMPLQEITDKVKANRKIGLGLMGVADFMIKNQVRYGSKESIELVEKMYKTTYKIAREHSDKMLYKNKMVMAQAPTGSLSILANCSSGIEPNFAWKTEHNRADFGKEVVVHKLAKPYLDNILQVLPEYFITANEVTPDEHLEVQATAQKYVDQSISKTINMPSSATLEEVDKIYRKAWDMGCKGITVYRDGSRSGQVLTDGSVSKKITVDESCVTKGILDRPYKIPSYTFKLQADLDGKIENLYINVGLVDNKPYEVFVNGNIRDVAPVIAQYIDTTTRLISLAMRYGTPIDKIVEQLEKVPCGHIYSIPHKVANVLKEFIPESIAVKCPECGFNATFSEGCLKCTSCGWGKCG